jgi:hypothetical protein
LGVSSRIDAGQPDVLVEADQADVAGCFGAAVAGAAANSSNVPVPVAAAIDNFQLVT